MKKVLMAIIVLFVVLQLVRPERQPATPPSTFDVMVRYGPPPETQRIIENACYDCHSNRTRYPWYAEIQPLGWLVERHVRNGRRSLNFSEFGRLPPLRAARKLDDCRDEIAEQRMPLPSYRLMHPGARLTPAEIGALSTWAEQISAQLREAAKSEK